MRAHRRLALKGIVAIATLAALPRMLFAARPNAAFESTDADKAIADLFGGPATQSDQVRMKIPDIAENGAVVPVTVSTDLPNVESISIIVDNNPTPLAASFNLGSRSAASVAMATMPDIQTRRIFARRYGMPR